MPWHESASEAQFTPTHKPPKLEDPRKVRDYFFLDDRLNDSYTAERKLTSVILLFSFMAIFVACLGLFGLATHNLESRTKEIGIRKVLGISSQQILVLLSKEFLLLIAIAFVIAIPLSYQLLQGWLNQFAYRVDIVFWPFLLAGAVTLSVALLTMGYHALRASRINPVESLRYE
ncbi:MAG: FtsX-like permease family protein [Bacteroidota bacterium]